jgi:GT2 family glycosyltransferase
MQFSIIIPTCNRLKDLKECLESIITQTTLPKEVLVIDNSNKNSDKVKNLLQQLTPFFENENISLRYIKNEKENSLTVAKNLGVECSSGGIISFLDDDVILESKYYEEIIKVYKNYPNAVGVEGMIISDTRPNKIKFLFSQVIGKLFYLGFREEDRCRVLPSLGVTYSMGNNVINCEWLSGATTFKRNILNDIKLDENLKKYSDNEDIDLSYRVFKRYPNGLYLTPYAKYWHKCSREGRNAQKELVYMKEIYSLYVFYKLISQNFVNKIIYFWSRLGKIFFNVISSMSKVSIIGFVENIYLIEAYIYCIRHINDIKKGDLNFFNKRLL